MVDIKDSNQIRIVDLINFTEFSLSCIIKEISQIVFLKILKTGTPTNNNRLVGAGIIKQPFIFLRDEGIMRLV